MTPHEKTLAKRYERLRLYDYSLHKAIYPRSYGGVGDSTPEGEELYRERSARCRRVGDKILRRAQKKFGSRIIEKTVSWCPEYVETYDVETLIFGGREVIDEEFHTPDFQPPSCVEAWDPLPVAYDSESSQGFIYAPADLAEVVKERILAIDPTAGVSIDDYFEVHDHICPPKSWDTRLGWRLSKLVERGDMAPVKIKLPEDIVVLPKRKISDEEAMDRIHRIVSSVGDRDCAFVTMDVQAVVGLTGRDLT